MTFLPALVSVLSACTLDKFFFAQLFDIYFHLITFSDDGMISENQVLIDDGSGLDDSL